MMTVFPNVKEGLLGGLCIQAVVVGLLALVAWWTISSRLVLLDRTTSTIHAAPELEREVIRLEQSWSPEHAATVTAMVNDAEKRLIADFDHLAIWIKDVKQHASSLNLQTSHTVQEGELTTLAGVAVVPVHLEVHVDETDQPYTTLLKFFRFLVEKEVRVDIQRTVMSGKGTGLEKDPEKSSHPS